MNGAKTAELVSLIERTLRRLDRLHGRLAAAKSHDIPVLGRTENSALIIAGLLESYYTCLETAFVRISHFFENSLSTERWHSDLLEKMTLRIEGVRIPAVSADGYGSLLELLKFRHFRRYYFETEYDWDRLDFLSGKLDSMHPRVIEDLTRFIAFLRAL
jgi:hypothetical protein